VNEAKKEMTDRAKRAAAHRGRHSKEEDEFLVANQILIESYRMRKLSDAVVRSLKVLHALTKREIGTGEARQMYSELDDRLGDAEIPGEAKWKEPVRKAHIDAVLKYATAVHGEAWLQGLNNRVADDQEGMGLPYNNRGGLTYLAMRQLRTHRAVDLMFLRTRVPTHGTLEEARSEHLWKLYGVERTHSVWADVEPQRVARLVAELMTAQAAAQAGGEIIRMELAAAKTAAEREAVLRAAKETGWGQRALTWTPWVLNQFWWGLKETSKQVTRVSNTQAQFTDVMLGIPGRILNASQARKETGQLTGVSQEKSRVSKRGMATALGAAAVAAGAVTANPALAAMGAATTTMGGLSLGTGPAMWGAATMGGMVLGGPAGAVAGGLAAGAVQMGSLAGMGLLGWTFYLGSMATVGNFVLGQGVASSAMIHIQNWGMTEALRKVSPIDLSSPAGENFRFLWNNALADLSYGSAAQFLQGLGDSFLQIGVNNARGTSEFKELKNELIPMGLRTRLARYFGLSIVGPGFTKENTDFDHLAPGGPERDQGGFAGLAADQLERGMIDDDEQSYSRFWLPNWWSLLRGTTTTWRQMYMENRDKYDVIHAGLADESPEDIRAAQDAVLEMVKGDPAATRDVFRMFEVSGRTAMNTLHDPAQMWRWFALNSEKLKAMQKAVTYLYVEDGNDAFKKSQPTAEVAAAICRMQSGLLMAHKFPHLVHRVMDGGSLTDAEQDAVAKANMACYANLLTTTTHSRGGKHQGWLQSTLLLSSIFNASQEEMMRLLQLYQPAADANLVAYFEALKAQPGASRGTGETDAELEARIAAAMEAEQVKEAARVISLQFQAIHAAIRAGEFKTVLDENTGSPVPINGVFLDLLEIQATIANQTQAIRHAVEFQSEFWLGSTPLQGERNWVQETKRNFGSAQRVDKGTQKRIQDMVETVERLNALSEQTQRGLDVHMKNFARAMLNTEYKEVATGPDKRKGLDQSSFPSAQLNYLMKGIYGHMVQLRATGTDPSAPGVWTDQGMSMRMEQYTDMFTKFAQMANSDPLLRPVPALRFAHSAKQLLEAAGKGEPFDDFMQRTMLPAGLPGKTLPPGEQARLYNSAPGRGWAAYLPPAVSQSSFIFKSEGREADSVNTDTAKVLSGEERGQSTWDWVQSFWKLPSDVKKQFSATEKPQKLDLSFGRPAPVSAAFKSHTLAARVVMLATDKGATQQESVMKIRRLLEQNVIDRQYYLQLCQTHGDGLNEWAQKLNEEKKTEELTSRSAKVTDVMVAGMYGAQDPMLTAMLLERRVLDGYDLGSPEEQQRQFTAEQIQDFIKTHKPTTDVEWRLHHARRAVMLLGDAVVKMQLGEGEFSSFSPERKIEMLGEFNRQATSLCRAETHLYGHTMGALFHYNHKNPDSKRVKRALELQKVVDQRLVPAVEQLERERAENVARLMDTMKVTNHLAVTQRASVFEFGPARDGDGAAYNETMLQEAAEAEWADIHEEYHRSTGGAPTMVTRRDIAKKAAADAAAEAASKLPRQVAKREKQQRLDQTREEAKDSGAGVGGAAGGSRRYQAARKRAEERRKARAERQREERELSEKIAREAGRTQDAVIAGLTASMAAAWGAVVGAVKLGARG
jgi:hypothetical protein